MNGPGSINRIYRLVWSAARGAWMVVSELGRSGSRATSTSRLNLALAGLAVSAGHAFAGGPAMSVDAPASTRAPIAQAAAAALPPQRVTSPAKSALGITPSALPQFASAGAGAAAELPTGGNVVAGQATIKTSAAELDITQTSQRASINWDTFNIGAQGVVNFLQPNSSAVTLNRVLDTQASRIAGRINANGQVVLINPNGVVFTKDASVDVGALVATTHSLSDADLLSGSTTFSRQGATGSVVNEGRITAAAGGYVALIAPEVRNQGVVFAQMGTVAMASGERVSLRFDDSHSLAGVLVTPSQIQALVDNRSAVIAPGGQIILSAQAADKLLGGVVRNSGNLEATGLAQVAGRVILEASDSIAHSGSITVDAQVNSSGNGGKVSLIASLDNPTSRTDVSGTISARGGALGGDGGFVETSAAQVKVSDGAKVDTRAPNGKTGLWLIDPTDYTITSDSVAEGANSTRASTVNSNLAITDVTISSANSIVVNGSADTGGAAQITGGSGHTLTLDSGQAIDIHAGATIQGDGSPLYLVMNGPGGVTVAGTINTTGGGVALNSGSASTISSSGSITTAALVTSAGSVVNNGALRFESYSSGGAGYTDNIAGTGTLILNGSADFFLGGNNTYTGATQVLSGNLVTADINSLGNGSAVNVHSGAQLVIQGNPSSPRPIGSLSGAGSVVLLNTLLVGSDGTNSTFSGVISEYGGPQSVTKVGSGTLTLSGASTYTGTTTVNSGQLALATEGALHYSSSVVVNGGVLDLGGFNQTLGNVQLAGGYIANGALSLTSGAAFELQSGGVNAVLQGGSGLNKTTSGTVTLSGNQAYNGDTTINGGTLVADGPQAIPSNSTVRIGSSGTLELAQSLTIANLSGGGHVNLNSNTLTTGGNNAGFENFYGGISGTGGLTKIGTGTFALSAYSGDNTYTGPTIVQAGTLQVNSQTPGNHAISAASAVSVSAGATLELLSDQAVGSIAGVAGSAVNLSGFTLSAGSNGSSTEFAGTMLGNGGALTKVGGGTLTLSGANTFTGNTTISGGTLQLGNGGSTGSLSGSSNIVLQNGAELAFNRPGTVLVQGTDFGNSISGTGNVHLAQGSLVLGGNNTYDGSTFIQGPLRLDSDNALPSGTLLDIEGWNEVHLDVNGHHATIGALQHGSTNDGGNGNVLLGGGSLTVSGSANTTYAGNITGSGSLIKGGTGILTLTGASSFDGETLITGGTLLVNGPQAVPIGSRILVGAAGAFELGQNQTIFTLFGNGQVKLNSYTLTTGYGTTEGQSDNFYGLMSGTGGLTKVGGGTQTLSGTSTYTGPTIVQEGTLEVSGGHALPGTSAVSISSGATLKVSSDQTIGTLAGDEGSFVNLGANTLTTGGDTGGASTTFAGAISGEGGGLTKYGNSKLLLTGANTYTGTTTILGDGSSQIHVGEYGGTTGSIASAQIINNGGLYFDRSDDQTLTTNISGTGSIYKNNSGTLTLSGTGTYTGSTVVFGGTLDISGSAVGDASALTLVGASSLRLSGNASIGTLSGDIGSSVKLNAYTLTTGGVADTNFYGDISGYGGLTKVGSGMLTLLGSNFYVGDTNVLGGTLRALGGTALSTNTAVTVASGATLDVFGALAVGSIAGSAGSSLIIEASSELQTGFNNTSTEFGGNISGPGNLAKGGTGVFTLSGANTYGGYTNVFTGTLLANGGSAIPDTSDVLVNPTATFRLGADETIGSLHGSASGLVDLGTHTLTTGAKNSSDYFEGVITGTGGLTKVGTGSTWLTGANTYTGTTTISSGYFSIGELTGPSVGLSGSVASSQIINNGSLTFARNDAITYSGNISGTGSVVKDGSGALTLTGVNSYSGSTIIQKGSLNGGGSAISSASAVLIVDNASLNLSADATIASLDGTASSAVNLGASTLTTGASNVSSNFAGAISGVGGGLTKLGSGTLTLSGANTYTGTTTIAQGAVTASSVAVSGGASNLGNATSAIVLGDATNTGTLFYAGGNATFTRGLNIQAGGGRLQLGGAGALTLSGGGVSAGGLFTVSGYHSVFLNSVISGTGGLSMLGSGVLYLSAANTYTGATTIGAAGTIVLGSGSTSGDIASTSGIANAGTLIVNRSDNLSLSDVTGGGALTKWGTGILTLGGNSNTFSTTYVQSGQITVASIGNSALGAVTINPAAALKVGNGGTQGSISFTSLTDNGTLIFDRTDNRTFSGTISGSGSLLKLNSNTLNLIGSNTYTGTTTIAQGAILAGSIVVSGGASNLGNASSAIVLGDATNTGTLIYTGGNATFTRGLNIQAGGGGLQVNGSTGLTLSGGGVVAGGLFTVSGSQAVFLNSVISGTGGLTVSSTNNVYIGAADTYTGTTTISSGQLLIGNGGSTGSLSTNSAIVNNGVLGFSRPGVNLVQGVDFSNTISGTGGLTVWTGTVVLGGAGATNTYSGATAINGILRLAGNNAIPQASAVSLATGATAGLDLSGYSDSIYSLSGGGASGGGITLGAGTLTVSGAGSTTYAGAISGTGGLTKDGSGTLTLSGTNTYTGATTVQAGTLTASGGSAIADTSVVTLSSGATLGLASSETIGSLTGSTGSFVTLGANRLSTGGTNATTTFAGVISGTGGVDKLGTGDFILTSANSYTGATTIASGGRIVVRKDAPTALSGAISGAGTLVIEPLSASFSSAVSTAGWGLSGGALANLVLGKVGNTAALTFGSATSVSNSVTAVGGSVTVSAPITATGAVNITASAPSTGGGNITVNAQVTTNTSATLQSTEASVVVGPAGAVAGLGSANVSLIGSNTGSNGSSDGVLINGGQVSTQAGIITLSGHGKALGAVANANGDGVHLVGGAVVHSSSGNINLIGTGSTTTGATTSSKGVGVLVNASDITSDTGSISLTGTGGTITPADSGVSYDARGIRLESGTVQTGGGGSITLTGYGGSINGNTSSPSTATLLTGGVVALGTLRTADGDINLGGSLGTLTGGPTQYAGGGTRGVTIGGLVETTGSGSIHVVGSGGSSNFAAGNFGVLLAGSTVQALGSGSIDITGTGGTSLSTGQSVAGVSSQQGVTIQTQFGSLQLTGTQGSLPGGASDWALQLNDLTLASTSGALSLTSAGGSIGLTTATGSTVSLQTSSVASSITGQTSISGGDVSVNVGTLTLSDLSIAAPSSLSVTGQQLVATGSTTLAGTVKAVGGTARFTGQLNGATSGSAVVGGGTLQLNGVSRLASLNQTGGAITGTGSLQVAGSFSQTAGSISGALTAVNVTQTTGNLVAGNIAANGDISLRSQAGAVNLNGVLQSSTGLVKVSATGGNLTIGPSAAVLAQAIGTAIALDTSSNFVNQSTSPLALNAPNGRWLVSSTNPTLDTRGALAADFKQYNSVAAETIAGYTGPSVGNGFLYTVAPVLTAAFGASVSKTYDGNNSADVSSTPIAASGAIDGDAVQLVGSSGSFDTRNAGSLKQVSANVAISSATNGATAVLGYQLASPTVSGNVGTITGKALTISGITAANKTYDGTTSAVVSTAAAVKTGLVAGDIVTVSSSGSFADKNAGLGKTVNLTSSYGGVDVGNYTITGQSTTTADIAKAALAVVANSASKTYDAVAYSGGNGVAYNGFVNGETASVLSGTLTYSGSSQGAINAGTYVITPTGLASNNYSFNYVSSALTVAKAPLTLTTVDVSKVYDGSTTAAGQAKIASGQLFGSDTVAGGTFAFLDPAPGTSKTVKVSSVTVNDGNSGGNYAVTYLDNQTSTILEAPVPPPVVIATAPVQTVIPPKTSVADPSSTSSTTTSSTSSTSTGSSTTSSGSGTTGSTTGSTPDTSSSSASAASSGTGGSTSGSSAPPDSSTTTASTASTAGSTPSTSASTSGSTASTTTGSTNSTSGATSTTTASSSSTTPSSTSGSGAGAKDAGSKPTGAPDPSAKSTSGSRPDAKSAIADTSSGKSAPPKLVAAADPNKNQGTAPATAKPAAAATGGGATKTTAAAKAVDPVAKAKSVANAQKIANRFAAISAGAIAAAAAGSPNSVAPRVTSVLPPTPLPTGYLASGGMLPEQLGAINKTIIPAVAPVCDGKCSPAAANIAVAMQAQAQAAGSLAAPGDSFAESFHEIPWRSNSGTNRAAKPRNITSYTEVLEEVNFINVLNLFIVP